ncbi:MAG TPA: hypothetical protein VFF39_10590, partial [Verrucomicrobiae bacterium]|nr:hypothetical protein [Verrucomicrobiae bacterium]
LAQVKRLFQGITLALREAGLKPGGPGHLIPTGELMLEWARVARKLKKLPPMQTYQHVARTTHVPFVRRYGSWLAVPEAFERFAEEKQIEAQWKDVLAMVAARKESGLRKRVMRVVDETAFDNPVSGEVSNAQDAAQMKLRYSRRNFLRDRAVAGPPLDLDVLAHEPANELGVVYFFGTQAQRLGFRVLTFQAVFPDCEAMREVHKGKWQRVRIEFEYESRNFKKHGHKRDGCDVIVCWRHNWPECPKSIEVVELCKIVGRN